jgi:phosphinothricin acetyltransferase
VEIVRMLPEHWEAVSRIYAEGIATGLATFETEVPAWEDWDAAHLADLRLVALVDRKVVGWSALSRVSSRRVYSGVTECSVYVAGTERGGGIGGALLGELVRRSEEAGIWTIQASIFPENTASLAVHERAGFRVVGTRERVARLDGAWRDIVLMERRRPDGP